MRGFAPGHITGFFSSAVHDDPLETGSRGAGIAIDDGVTVDVEEADSTVVVLEDDTVEFEPVERVLEMMSVDARVEIETDVPLGCGFGASGAAALATGLAANEVFGLGLEREQVVSAAHVADVESGTGLGDVVPQSLGGIVTRVEEGAPELGTFGKIDHDEDEEIGYTVLGGLDTSDVLSDDETMERINEAGEEALDEVLRNPSVEGLIEVSWEFARETGLVTDEVETQVEEIEEEGGVASMAMLGETVFGVGGEDVFDETTRIDDEGARLLS